MTKAVSSCGCGGGVVMPVLIAKTRKRQPSSVQTIKKNKTLRQTSKKIKEGSLPSKLIVKRIQTTRISNTVAMNKKK